MWQVLWTSCFLFKLHVGVFIVCAICMHWWRWIVFSLKAQLIVVINLCYLGCEALLDLIHWENLGSYKWFYVCKGEEFRFWQFPLQSTDHATVEVLILQSRCRGLLWQDRTAETGTFSDHCVLSVCKVSFVRTPHRPISQSKNVFLSFKARLCKCFSKS